MKKISSKKILFILVGIMVLLLALHMIFMTAKTDNKDYWQLVGLFNMDSEVSLFSWYSATILLFVPAVLSFYIWWLQRQTKEKSRWGWLIAAIILLYLSIDDGSMIHEKLGIINRMTGLQGVLNGISSSWFAWSWWVMYVPFAILAGIFLWRWFWSLPVRTRVIIAVAIAVAALGQVGMEAVSSHVTNSTGQYVGLVWRGFQKFTGRLGLSLFLYAIVDYILSMPKIRSRFTALVASPKNARRAESHPH